jgi:hypothetical protein
MVTYYLKESTLTPDSADYHAVITQHESAEGDVFVKQAAETLNKSEGEVIGILHGLADSAATLVRQGRGFKLPGFCKFSFGIHGSFAGPDEPWNPAIQKMVLNIRADRALTAAAQEAPKTRIHGVTYGPVIDAVVDMVDNTTNTSLHPGGMNRLIGKDIKIAGTDPNNGIRLIDEVGDSTQVTTEAIGHNSPTELLFICPNLPAGTYQVEVWTQYTSGGYLMDVPRFYRFEPKLTVI